MSLTTYKLRYFVGAPAVQQVADAMAEAGLRVIIRGTEHVWIEHEGANFVAADDDALERLRRSHGNVFGLDWAPRRDVVQKMAAQQGKQEEKSA